jgi:sec-independent protein translocase protein TatA
MGGFSIWHWLIVLVVVLLLFGAKKLPTVGGDLAKAIKSFRKGLQDEEPGKLEAERKDAPSSANTDAARERRD